MRFEYNKKLDLGISEKETPPQKGRKFWSIKSNFSILFNQTFKIIKLNFFPFYFITITFFT